MGDAVEALTVYEDERTGNKLVPYVTGKGVEVDLLFDGEQPWFTRADLADMFGVTVPTVVSHIQSFMDANELDDSTIRDFLIVRKEGNREVERQIMHYSLDVAFYVGYRVNSTEGKLFRRWATTMLVQLATKGFVIDRRRLKGGKNAERLRELREIIRDLRSEEANLYAELIHICAMCQDYDPKSKEAHKFFQFMQAKIFYAVAEKTPSQVIAARANAKAENMGLKSWAGDRPLQSDALVGKNYLDRDEIDQLNRLTTILLDVFEDQVKIGKLTKMTEAAELLDGQLQGLNRKIIKKVGPPSADKAKKLAKDQYRIFNQRRRKIAAEESQRVILELKAAGKSLPKPPAKKRTRKK